MASVPSTPKTTGPPPLNDDAERRFKAIFHTVRKGTEVTSRVVSYKDTFPAAGADIRWIHLPENSLASVNICFANCGRDLDSSISNQKVRPIFAQSGKNSDFTPSHATHMEPSVEWRRPEARENDAQDRPTKAQKDKPSNLPLLSVYLPYMSWMLFEEYKTMRGEILLDQQRIKSLQRNTSTSIPKPSLPNARSTLDPDRTDSEPLILSPEMIDYLGRIPNQQRRTLDQFGYPALQDTSARDGDQTISKWTGKGLQSEGRIDAADDSILLMVDQFWCWVLDDKTIVTSFPSDKDYDIPNFASVYKFIREGAEKCANVWDLHALMIREVVGYMFDENKKDFQDLIATYRWVTRKKAATQSTMLQAFHKGYVSGKKDQSIYDDKEQLKLLLEVVDIVDELKIIRQLLVIQENVLGDFISALKDRHRSNSPPEPSRAKSKILTQGIAEPARQHVVKADETLSLVLAEIDSITQEADYTHKMLLDLLSLKNTSASLGEAQAATKQGRAVMLFTIVTIIFLPLSFFTSYFGQNVREITGDENNPSTWDLWRVATPISVVVIFIALVIAYYITKPESMLWSWMNRRRIKDEEKQA